MEMHNLGYKYNDSGMAVPSKPDKTEHYPSIHISDKVPDFLMEKEIGSECRVECVIKLASKGINEHGEKKNKNVSFDILKIGFLGKAGKKTKDEYLDSNDKEREDYDKESVDA